jgi:hypothetical protein
MSSQYDEDGFVISMVILHVSFFYIFYNKIVNNGGENICRTANPYRSGRAGNHQEYVPYCLFSGIERIIAYTIHGLQFRGELLRIVYGPAQNRHEVGTCEQTNQLRWVTEGRGKPCLLSLVPSQECLAKL